MKFLFHYYFKKNNNEWRVYYAIRGGFSLVTVVSFNSLLNNDIRELIIAELIVAELIALR